MRAALVIRIFCVISLCTLLLWSAAGCSKKYNSSSDDAGKLKVAFVYIGPVGDAGWTLSHDKGRKYMEEQLPYVKTSFVENVAETSDAERVITNLAIQGNSLIFTTSYGYMDATLNVAKKYPKITFMHCSGYKTSDNVGTYFGRMYQARYLTGIVAGKMTKTNIIGYVAAHPIPEVVRGINAFALGARKVNPRVKIKIVWTHTWYDPPSEREAASSLLDSKADVIAQHQDTYAPQQAAQEANVYGIGYNTDMSSFAPKAELTSAVWNWGPYYKKIAEEVHGGTWKSSNYWGSIKEGIVDLAPFGSMVPEDVKTLVKTERENLENGKYDVFDGPIKDNTGKEHVKAGARMTDDEMLKFDWFVEGVEGSVQTGVIILPPEVGFITLTR
ncbi:MAG: BMP family ABC transporter substrate-binding protein [Candidatus Xenobiia bacterium LiM19]